MLSCSILKNLWDTCIELGRIIPTFPIVIKNSVAIVTAIVPNEGEYYQSGIASTVDDQYSHQNARTGFNFRYRTSHFWFTGVEFLIAPNQLSELLNPQPLRSPHWRLVP